MWFSWFLPSCFVTVFGRCNVYLRCAYIVTYIYVFVKLHTQHNDVFIRFYFLSVWACPIGHVAQAVQRPAHCPIVPARLVWYREQTGAARKASGRAWSALHLARPALLPVICGLSRCAGGWGLHRRGIQGAPGVGWVMPAIKFSKEKGVFRGSCCQHPPHLHKTNPI